jgi:hypothetical protein
MRQRESDTSTFHWIDNLSRSIRYAGRVLIDLIPKIYDSERIIRIMGDTDEEEFVPINQVMYGYDGVPQMVNDLSTARFDVRVTIGPSYSTKRQETAASLLEFLKISPDAAPLVMDIVAKNMDFPGAEEIAKRLKTVVPPHVLVDPDDPETQPPPPPDPMEDPTIRADVEYKQAQTRKALADAAKTEIEAQRMATGADQPPPEMPPEPEPVDPMQGVMSEAQARKSLAEARMAELGVENYVSPAEMAERKASMSPPARPGATR